MRIHETCTRPEPGPAVAVESADRPAPARRLRPVDGWFLDEMRTRAERQCEAIHARYDWIEARRRELWARTDRMHPAAADGGAQVPPAEANAPAAPRESAPRPATVFQNLAERIECLIGIMSSLEPGADGDGAPRPEPVPEAGAAR